MALFPLLVMWCLLRQYNNKSTEILYFGSVTLNFTAEVRVWFQVYFHTCLVGY